eukprot:1985431-Amphidinium_carterae.2
MGKNGDVETLLSAFGRRTVAIDASPATPTSFHPREEWRHHAGSSLRVQLHCLVCSNGNINCGTNCHRYHCESSMFVRLPTR